MAVRMCYLFVFSLFLASQCVAPQPHFAERPHMWDIPTPSYTPSEMPAMTAPPPSIPDEQPSPTNSEGDIGNIGGDIMDVDSIDPNKKQPRPVSTPSRS